MFSQLKHLDHAFRYVRLFSLIIIVLCMGLCGFVLYKSYQLAALTQSKVYILANGKALEALAADRKENIGVEARDHISLFHSYFFNLDPDDKSIQVSLTKSLYLADESAKQQFQNLKESGYYASLIAGNISQRIQVDSIELNTVNYPYYFRLYGRQTVLRATSVLHRHLVTEGYLRNVNRSENNTHGFLIEKWKTLDNTDITTENR
ncbi:conjugative transposon protein TraK [Puia sp. P3]|uniref:conjugative transposon protein TraK n=1 Tax=Puia sp. P3 TaxID=3423952 RepID=UPI003D664B4C